ncbi:MAG: DUF1849 family protein [Alphaproteobacteria bacterium]|nr:MAG: DUF1849 family protein [Alphaproteobacteria bacterium]
MGAFLLLALTACGAPAPAATASMEEIVRKLAPHRAVYDLKLGNVAGKSDVRGAQGKIVMEWGDACDGWTSQQNFAVDLLNVNDSTVAMTTSQTSWEAKDGSRFRFQIRRQLNGKDQEEYRGHAVQRGLAGGQAHFDLPKAKKAVLPTGTVFPTQHVLKLLQMAMDHENFATFTVFDGDGEEGYSDISAFILSRVDKIAPIKAPDSQPIPLADHRDGDGNKEEQNQDAQVDADLLNAPGWNVHLAFFSDNNNDLKPNQESDIVLLENGVMREATINYGDFTITATLRSINRLPPSLCTGEQAQK